MRCFPHKRQSAMTGLHFHDLGFFFLAVFGDLFDEAIGQLLKFFFTTFQIILRDQFFLFKIAHVVVRIAADIANGNPRLLQTMMHMLDQVTAAFFVSGGRLRWMTLPSLLGFKPKVRGQDRFFNRLERGPIKRFDHQRTRFRHADRSQLHERRGRPVIFDWQSFHKTGAGASGTDRCQVIMKDLNSATHARFGIFENIFYHHSLLEC